MMSAAQWEEHKCGRSTISSFSGDDDDFNGGDDDFNGDDDDFNGDDDDIGEDDGDDDEDDDLTAMYRAAEQGQECGDNIYREHSLTLTTVQCSLLLTLTLLILALLILTSY